MFRSFYLLVTSQSLANLADVFLRLSLIADIYLVTHSVMATTVIPVLIWFKCFYRQLFGAIGDQKIANESSVEFYATG